MKIDLVATGILAADLIILGKAPRNLKDFPSWAGMADQVKLVPAGSIGYCVQALSKLGVSAGVIGEVGNDVFGKFIIDELRRLGIEVSRIRVADNKLTWLPTYLLLFRKRKRPIIVREGTSLSTFDEEDFDYIKYAKLFHSGGFLHLPEWGVSLRGIYKRAKEEGLTTSLDPQFPLRTMKPPWIKAFGGLLEYVDILLCDESEAVNITGCASFSEAAKEILSLGPKIAAIKRGAHGCYIQSSNLKVGVPAFRVMNIVDSIGAGDVWDAGFLTGILEDWTLIESARFANASAAFSLKGIGGISSLPPRITIEQFLRHPRIPL